ncbi:hypothetical protein [Bradyrhizobium sp. AUGA SZCCT0283]|uniref:hypothetical protein n=1 Tax=Bradyrhizobium sp. AUGA SZCCT0283 TaxID=2807671 RepID=UPI001BA701EA|nr:hypothetical protein [Bradyrhizobium sp. AUGA SZCCT0283]MBR1279277.1 hypothetical protein [Bradyrhizobium sp. AUGA SZCCT0283]
MFDAENAVMQTGNPLATRNGQAQILDAVFNMHRDAIPKKIGPCQSDPPRGIAKLPVHPDFLEFDVERVGLAGDLGSPSWPIRSVACTSFGSRRTVSAVWSIFAENRVSSIACATRDASTRGELPSRSIANILDRSTW